MKKVDKSETATLSQRTGDLIIAKKELAYQTKGELIKELQKLQQEYDSLKTSYLKDIIERKQAEEALRESEEKHRTLIEQSIDGIVITDEHGNVSVWNKSMESITGIQQCETIGRPLCETQSRLIPVEQKTPELLGQLRNGLKNLMESKMEWLGESRDQTIIDVNGTHKVVQDSTFMIKTNNKMYFGTIIRDITERILTEKALQKSEERFRSITEQVTDVIFMTDTKGIIIYISPSARSVFGYSQEEMISMPFVTFLEKKNIPKAMARFTFSLNNLSLMSGRKHENLTLLMKHKDGYAFTGELTSNAFYENEIVTGTIGVIRNISQRIQAEEEIRKSKELLENLNQRFIEIRENERAHISREIHDQIGQSLTALKLDMNWMRKYMNINPEAVAKLEGMIGLVSNTIKDVQRISSDLRPGILDDLGLASAVEWYCNEFEVRTGIRCTLKLKDSTYGDTRKNLIFFRILQEALTNIIRHANASSVSILLHQSKQGITMTIKDNGIGMLPGKAESGKSLGLIGMRERVKEFEGKIDISSKEGQGTKLTIFIPE